MSAYQTIIQNIGLVVFQLDKMGTILSATPTIQPLTGYAPDELVGQSYVKLIHPNWRGRTDMFPIVTKDKRECWVEQHHIPESNEIVWQDITELRQNELRFRGLYENNNDAVFIIDMEGYIQAANNRACEMLGYAEGELEGMHASINTVSNIQHSPPETITERLLRGEKIPVYERTFRRKDGSLFPGEANVALVYNRDGTPSHIQSIVRDITERKQYLMERDSHILQLLILRQVDEELGEHLNVDYALAIGLDFSLRLTNADAGFIALLTQQNDLKVAHMTGEYPPNFQPTLTDSLIGDVLKTLHPAHVTKNNPYKHNRPQTVEQIAIPLINSEQLIGVLMLESDREDQFTSERFEIVQLVATRMSVAIDNAQLHRQTKEQLEQLRDLYKQVSELERLKTDMIRVAAHDLRNPLSTIITNLDIMRQDLNDGVTDSSMLLPMVHDMERASNRMYRIIRDILSLERIQESMNDQTAPLINLNNIIQAAFGEQRTRTRSLNKRMMMNTPTNPVMVRGDETQLSEIINNLIENAIKYTADMGLIQVMLQADEIHAIFTVEDNGFGIPQEEHENLFKPFYRVKTVETEHIKGTGLGLHLVKNMVERHKGQIIFQSVYGTGSTFGFKMPIADT